MSPQVLCVPGSPGHYRRHCSLVLVYELRWPGYACRRRHKHGPDLEKGALLFLGPRPGLVHGALLLLLRLLLFVAVAERLRLRLGLN
jgi:hypothetical protein